MFLIYRIGDSNISVYSLLIKEIQLPIKNKQKMFNWTNMYIDPPFIIKSEITYIF